MLAPYKILGMFKIAGVPELKGQVYAYEGHTYYLDENGIVNNVTVTSGSFDTGATINLSIKGVSYAFNVLNLYKTNTLTLVK